MTTKFILVVIFIIKFTKAKIKDKIFYIRIIKLRCLCQEQGTALKI